MARATYICGGDLTPRPDTTSDCPQRAQHTPEPSGYGDWFKWAEAKAKTHTQTRCAGCGLLKVWVRKEATDGRAHDPV